MKQVRITDALHQQIAEEAARTGRSIQREVERLLEQGFRWREEGRPRLLRETMDLGAGR